MHSPLGQPCLCHTFCDLRIALPSYFEIRFLQDILPSDDPDTTKGSSLFGTRSPLPSVTVNDSTPAASFSRKTEANESHSEDTETESEWEKERAQKKAQRDEEIEKVSWPEQFSNDGRKY